ncbi:MAG: ATP-binding cassette domain-containing protein [Candidatus Nealsonbacteria bacterium]|nr:ATP-binding cassette domain-containing protein [Candidatus Nealsonbacteria bacterium]
MENIIEVKNLNKNFKGFKAVDDVSFSVGRGQMFAFLGPNGAGKTTLIKMLTTLLHPTSGTILINSKNPVKEQDEARRAFSIVFQDPSLDDKLTAYENMEFHAILYGEKKDTRKERIENLLKFMDLWDRRNDLVEHFSGGMKRGGMKRRLEIARGLIHYPKILFLDEPTIGLDIQTRRYIWEYIEELSEKEKMTVFFTTHYIEEAEQIADCVTIIDHGKIIASGTPKQLEEKTNTSNLADAFIKLTGENIREEEAGNVERMRSFQRMHRR